MKQEISLTRTTNSRLSAVDFNNIPFGRIFSDHMFVAEYEDGIWQNPRIVPFDSFSMHPCAMVLHYGQAIFEGMKASINQDGVPLLLRPHLHAERFNNSARRMCMPTIPDDLFLEAVHKLVGLDKDWIPPVEGSALYIRPVMFATEAHVGVRPAAKYTFIILTSPVGPYYPRPVSLVAETHYIRAAHGGVGEAKTAGNYAAAMLPVLKAQEEGYDQVLWLDANEHKYVQEVGTMNIFFVIDGTVVTPAADGAILKGITRKTIMELLRDKGYKVEERKVTIHELLDAYKAGKLDEAFGSGTAAVVAYINKIAYKDEVMEFDHDFDQTIGGQVKKIINGMRAGTIQDTHDWMVPVEVPAELDA